MNLRALIQGREVKEILKELQDPGENRLIGSHILPELSELWPPIGIIDSRKADRQRFGFEIVEIIRSSK